MSLGVGREDRQRLAHQQLTDSCDASAHGGNDAQVREHTAGRIFESGLELAVQCSERRGFLDRRSRVVRGHRVEVCECREQRLEVHADDRSSAFKSSKRDVGLRVDHRQSGRAEHPGDIRRTEQRGIRASIVTPRPKRQLLWTGVRPRSEDRQGRDARDRLRRQPLDAVAKKLHNAPQAFRIGEEWGVDGQRREVEHEPVCSRRGRDVPYVGKCGDLFGDETLLRQ